MAILPTGDISVLALGQSERTQSYRVYAPTQEDALAQPCPIKEYSNQDKYRIVTRRDAFATKDLKVEFQICQEWVVVATIAEGTYQIK